MRRVGLGFCGQPYTVDEIISASITAERNGYDSVWITEDIWTGRDALSILSMMALSTENIRLGTAVIGVYTRHPILIAQTLNVISEIAPDRCNLGIGAGMTWEPFLSEQVRQNPPLGAMREAILSIRGLLNGEEIEFRGEKVRLAVTRPCFTDVTPYKSKRVPIYMGAVGPKMTQLAGEIADAIILELGVRARDIPKRLEQMEVGAKRANRGIGDMDVAELIMVSVSDKGEPHTNALGYAIKHLSNLDTTTINELDFDPVRIRRIREAYIEGDCDTAYSLISPELAAAFVAVGTQDEILSYIEDIVNAGVKLPILLPFGGDIQAVIEVGVEYSKRN
jgi:5,10-methylenetetrahydromethanopterin reductase